MEKPSFLRRGISNTPVQPAAQAPKTVLAVAKLYKGVLIFQSVDGFVIYGEDGNKHNFISQPEAEAFVDAFEVAVFRSIFVGSSPIQ